MLLSLETSLNVEVLVVSNTRTTLNRRYQTSRGDSAGVEGYVRGRQGLYGNTGEPTISLRKQVKDALTQTIRACRVHITTLQSAKKRRYRKEVSGPSGSEGKEKDGGSLSIPIVLIERWKISSMKAT
jgi:hypothetical protein